VNLRRLLPAALAVFAALVAALLFATLHRPGGTNVLPGSHAVSVEARLSPQDPQFGDTVRASAEVLVDRKRVDPHTIRLRTGFAPYRLAAATRSIRTSGGYSVVRLEQVLRCVSVLCVPSGARKTFHFAPLRVAYREGSARRTLAISWPVLRVHSRVAAADLSHPVLRVPPAPPPSRYRLSPGVTGYTLLALAAVLALGGAALVVRAGLRVWATHLRRREPLLDRILWELAAAASDGDARRRRQALEQLARELEHVDGPLSTESRALAWAPSDPPADSISELTTRVRAVMAQ
jgi:hypothetical protein